MMNSSSITSWQFDEFHPVGRDYDAQSEVDVYDSSHADFRDFDAECERALNLLGVNAETTLIDFGCGTGTFAVAAAGRCRAVHAVDVSTAMLQRAQTKANQAGRSNLTFHHAGFLTYAHSGQPVDAITTTYAFHHLPDFWKGIALGRLHGLLRHDGRLYLRDVIIESINPTGEICAFIQKQEIAGGAFLREDAEGHFKDEFSTYDWIMDGLLTRAGFAIEHRAFEDGVIGTYVCRKVLR